jgi:hypothetical protein
MHNLVALNFFVTGVAPTSQIRVSVMLFIENLEVQGRSDLY